MRERDYSGLIIWISPEIAQTHRSVLPCYTMSQNTAPLLLRSVAEAARH